MTRACVNGKLIPFKPVAILHPANDYWRRITSGAAPANDHAGR